MSQSPIKIRFARDAYTKFMYFIQKCDQEVGFMGKTIFNPEQMSYDILSVYVPKQEVSSAATDLDAQDVANLEAATYQEKGHLNAWLHSHVNMPTFWSGVDRDTIKEIGVQGLCVAIVGNKKREMRGAIYYKGIDPKHTADGFYPCFPTEAFYDDVKIEVFDRVLASQVSEWDKLLADNVKTRVWQAPVGNGRTYYPDEADYTYAYHRQGSGVKLYEEHKVNSDGVIPLSRREQKKLRKAREKAEREKQNQMTLLGDDTPPTAVGGGNTYSKLSQPLYSDVELYHMTFTELAAELRHMVEQNFISKEEKGEIEDQWRTCNLRINEVDRKVK